MSTLAVESGSVFRSTTGGAAAETAVTPCTHCGLPVPSGLLRAGAERQFCCHACETAHHAICGSGLEQYYEHRRAGSHGVLSPARSSGNRYEAYDDPAFADAYGAARPDGLRSTTLALEGLHCAACVWLLERVPSVMPGVVDVRVDFGRSHVTVVHDPRSVSLSKVARFMDRLGYTSHPLRDGSAREARLHHDRSALIRIAVAGALFGNAMVISFALYGAKADGMEPAMRLFLHGVSAVLAGGSVLGPGWVFFRGALASLRVRALHMDVPIALALSVGLIHGVTNTIRGSGEVYFDTLCTLVFLLLIGRWIQQKQQRSASDAIERLFSFCTSAATLVEGDATRVVPIEALRGGDTVEVRAGESVPVDGEVVRGHSTVNNAFLTGESAPIEVMPGETVAAGSVNLSSPIRVRATATGRGTRLGQLMALVAEEARRKAPIVRMADRIAAWFVAVVLALAAATFVFWLSHGVEAAVEHTVALLIITCPCALGLATPLAIVAALGRAAREGVLIKGGDVLESLAGRGTIVLDKTGTLTTGQWRVVEYHGDERLKPLIAAAERGCAHPAARALVGAFGCGEMQGPPVTLRNVVGGGIVAEVGSTELTIGSVRFVRERHPNAALSDRLSRAIESALARGLSVVLIAERGEVAGCAVVGDEIRPEASRCLARLRSLGWNTVLLSGDHERIVRSVGAQLGFEDSMMVGEASPQVKAEVVRGLRADGPTIMIGDGVNDAAALAAATVGVAVQGGAEAAMSSADVYLSRPGLEGLVGLVERARRTTGAIRRNLAVSLLYNVLFGSLAMAGMVNPLVAAVLMPLSSLTVIVLSFHHREAMGRSTRTEGTR